MELTPAEKLVLDYLLKKASGKVDFEPQMGHLVAVFEMPSASCGAPIICKIRVSERVAREYLRLKDELNKYP